MNQIEKRYIIFDEHNNLKAHIIFLFLLKPCIIVLKIAIEIKGLYSFSFFIFPNALGFPF